MNRYDTLTGLLTREAFFEEAEALLRQNPEKKYDIILSDFVNFKHFNTRFGTEAGDFLLIKTGEMLSVSGPDVICARYGGDRFVSITEHLNDFAIDYLRNFRLPEHAKDELPIESVVVKFGICANIDTANPISVYCDRALIAVQNIKHIYGQNVGFYDELSDQKIKQELKIEEEMVGALQSNQFEVYYQPKYDIYSAEIIGSEALVRWVHPTHGIISPISFLPLFERNGFITALDTYVWEKVCRDLAQRKAAGLRVVPVSVNLSRVDLNTESLIDTLTEITNRYGVEHCLLHIEITESAYTDKPDFVLKQIKTLHEKDFVIELDDFGVGYSSLSFLSSALIDIIKLDRSLLSENDTDTGKNVLSFAIQMANMMQLRTIQEGVETEEQVSLLKKLGCDMVQGFLFSRPLPADVYFRLLDGNVSGT